MKQNIPYDPPGLISGSAETIGGLTLHGAGIGVVLNTTAALTADRAALMVADAAYEAGKDEWTTRKGALKSAMTEAGEFVTLYRELLKPTLGKRHSEAWDATGFRNNLRVPKNPNDMLALVVSMEAFLTGNAAFHNTDLDINPASASGVGQNLLNAINAVNAQETEVIRLKGLRDAAMRKLRLRLTGLVAEVKQLIPGLDGRWVSLGFNRPGLKERPNTPLNLAVTQVGGSSLLLKWDKAARAEYYRVWVKIAGVHTELTPIGSPTDLGFSIEGLPANALIEIAISAINNGGESVRSDVVTVTTP